MSRAILLRNAPDGAAGGCVAVAHFDFHGERMMDGRLIRGAAGAAKGAWTSKGSAIPERISRQIS